MNDHDTARAAAIERLQNKRDFRYHAQIYLAVNVLLILVWLASGAGSFWPIWPLLGWGLGLALHAWSIYGQRDISEEEITEELQRRH